MPSPSLRAQRFPGRGGERLALRHAAGAERGRVDSSLKERFAPEPVLLRRAGEVRERQVRHRHWRLFRTSNVTKEKSLKGLFRRRRPLKPWSEALAAAFWRSWHPDWVLRK